MTVSTVALVCFFSKKRTYGVPGVEQVRHEIFPRSRSEHFTFAKQIFHREAISLARMGKFRWGICDKADVPRSAVGVRPSQAMAAVSPSPPSSELVSPSGDTRTHAPAALGLSVPPGPPKENLPTGGGFSFGGPGGIRTHDLCVANAALSQLSYKPKRMRYILLRGDYSTYFPICQERNSSFLSLFP